MKHQYLSIFAGVGGGVFGARAAGYEIIGAVEFDPKIADYYYQNHQSMVLIQDVKDVDPSVFKVDKSKTLTVQISPPCTQYSSANLFQDHNSPSALALDNCYHILDYLKPDRIIIENVRAFQNSAPMDRFRKWLNISGYTYIEQIVSCANIGVPQSRIRYFLMAVKGHKLSYLPRTHTEKSSNQLNLFGDNLKPWVGWYEAIKDLIRNMEITELSPNQKLALREWNLNHPQLPRLLIPTIGYHSDLPPVYSDRQLAPTVKAMMMSDGDSERKGCWRLIDNCEVREMNVRGLARLQTFPDDMILSGNKGLDCKMIGNAVSPIVMQRILENCFDD
jgi:DNA (cytosine-5)-methyltransferase 1